MIEYIKGNLFSAKHPMIAHGCNAQGVMGSGVAKIIKEKFPEAYIIYKEECASGLNMPFVSYWAGNGTIIANCITQKYFGYNGVRYVLYDYVDYCMEELNSKMICSGIEYVAMPKIGSGLGGGDWRVIEAIINSRLSNQLVKVYEL